MNRGIKNTLDNEPEHFFSFNNGITATAEAIKTIDANETKKILSLDNFQIVNGGQTTASVHAAYRRKADLSKVFVQAKITVLDPEAAAELVPRISEYANSQNKVTAADFFSNHPFHIRIEGFSRTVYAPAKGSSFNQTKWFYERARGSYRDARANLAKIDQKKFDAEFPRKQVFSKTDLAKYLMVWTDDAYIVNRGAQKNFSKFASIIEDKWDKSKDSFNEYYYKCLIAKKIIFNEAEKIITTREWYEAGGYRSQHVAFTVGLIAHSTRKMKKQVDFLKIWSEQQVSQALAKTIGQASDHVHNVLMNPGQGYRNISEWAKQEKCWTRVKEHEIQWDESWLSELLDASEARELAKSGKKEQRLLDGINAQSAVVKAYEADDTFWLNVSRWVRGHNMASETELGCLSAATRIGKNVLPNDSQCVTLVNMMNRIEKEGCPYKMGKLPRRRARKGSL